MGFNSIAKKQRDKADDDGFKPSTPKQLKEYARRAKEKKRDKRDEEEREESKSERKQKRKLPRGADAIKLALEQNQKVRTFNPQLFEKFLEHVHMLDIKKPAYRLYLKKEEQDAAFMYEIQVCLAKMSWQQLGQLIGAGVDAPIPTKSWTDAFHKALNVMISAFGVEHYLQNSKGGSDYCKITDRDALDAWPVAVRQRRSGSTTEEEDDMHTDENNRKLRALGGDDDDEDEDEAPKGRGKSDDDDDEDDDEKPRAKRASAKSFGKGVGKKKRASRSDDDEDEKPARKAKKASKSNGEDDEPEVELNDRSLLVKAKDRDKGGVKTKVLELVPARKAATMKNIVLAAKEEGINPTKARKALADLHKYGYIRVR